MRIDPMHLKHHFCQIDPNGRNLHGDAPFHKWLACTSTLAPRCRLRKGASIPLVMDRRAFIGTLAGSLLTVPLITDAQQAKSVPRIGFLEAGAASANQHFLDAFQSGLRELGYVPGKTVMIDDRWAGGQAERFPKLLAELVTLRPDVIVV